MALAALRQQIATVVAGGPPSTSPALGTGIRPFDALLPSNGIPRGRVSELLAPAGSGRTSIARALVASTLAAGSPVAWIDATRTLDARDWPDLAGEALWVVRPPTPARGAWSTDLLLRTGAFALVVLDGAPSLPRNVGVRLAHLARETDSALLLLGEGPRASDLGSPLRLRITPHRRGDTRRIAVTLERGGPYRHVVLDLANGTTLPSRLCAHPQVPDRRSVVRRKTPLRR